MLDHRNLEHLIRDLTTHRRQFTPRIVEVRDPYAAELLADEQRLRARRVELDALHTLQ